MALYVYKDLKQCAEKIAAAFGLSDDDGRRVIGWFNVNQREKIADIIAGDLSSVPAVLDSLGIRSAQGVNTTKKEGAYRSQEKKKSKQKEGKKEPRKAGGVSSPAVDITTGAAVECETVNDVPGVLPDNVPGIIADIIADYCQQNDIDSMTKARQPEWSAACYFVGVSLFRNSKILHDTHREKTHGGTVYDVGRVSALVDVWRVLCARFCKAPIITDFADFCGISAPWFYGTGSRDGLTPARSALLQKMRAAQEGGLAGLIVDGRQNPTGALAMLNHAHGWTQSREIIHTSAAEASSAGSLPDFGSSSGILVDSGSGSGGSGQ